MVSRDLGPEASVLHSREVRSGLMRWLGGGKQIEVVATTSLQVPSRLPTRMTKPEKRNQNHLEPPVPFDLDVESEPEHEYVQEYVRPVPRFLPLTKPTFAPNFAIT